MPRILLLSLLFLIALPLMGCERQADLDNPKTFDNPQVSFDYPGNWTVMAQPVEGGHEIHVESPGDAILMIIIMEPKLNADLRQFAKSIVDIRAEEAKKMMSAGEVALGDVGETSSKMVSTVWNGGEREAVQQSFVITALDEPVPHVALFHAIESPTRDGFVMSQVATEDLEKVRPGFQLVWKTLNVK